MLSMAELQNNSLAMDFQRHKLGNKECLFLNRTKIK
jgi:hypothetical protein